MDDRSSLRWMIFSILLVPIAAIYSAACDHGEPSPATEPIPGISSCQDTSQCGDGLQCLDGKCISTERAECNVDDECTPGKACIDKKCIELTGLSWLKARQAVLQTEPLPSGCSAIKRTLYVSPSGSNDGVAGDGSSEKPYKTIQFAIDKIADSDECSKIIVRPGLYRERTIIKNKSKLVIEGTDRDTAIVKASEPPPTKWSLISECAGKNGCKVYSFRSKENPRSLDDIPGIVSINDKTIMEINHTRAAIIASMVNDFNAALTQQLSQRRAQGICKKDFKDADEEKQYTSSVVASLFAVSTNASVIACSNSLTAPLKISIQKKMRETILDNMINSPKIVKGDSGEEVRTWAGLTALSTRLPSFDPATGNLLISNQNGDFPKYFDVFIRLKDLTLDPSSADNEAFISPSWGAAFSIEGSNDVLIRNLTAHGGESAIRLQHSGGSTAKYSKGIIIEGNRIFGGIRTLFLYSTEQATVRYNEISTNMALDTSPYAPEANTTFGMVKSITPWADTWAILIKQSGDDHKIIGNYIHDVHDGIQDYASGDDLSNKTKNLEVGYNYIEQAIDDCLEPTGGEINARWHDNYLKDCAIGMRTKFGTSTTPFAKGPIYIYRNIFNNRDNFGNWEEGNQPPHTLFNIYIFAGSNSESYIYNNTFVGFEGIVFGSTNPAIGVPKMLIVNNIFSNRYFPNQRFASWPTNDTTKMPIFDYNWIGGKTGDPFYQEVEWKRGKEIKSVFRWGDSNIDARAESKRFWGIFPAPGGAESVADFCVDDISEVSGKGIDLSAPFSISIGGVSIMTNHAPLPGMENYYKGSPHIGAFPPGFSGCRLTPQAIE